MPTLKLTQPAKRYEPPPRWATPRTDRPTRGHELAAIGTVLGTPFHPWQRQVADVGLEYDPDTGLLAYRMVVVTVPRQTGKTTLVFCWECDRCISDWWGTHQRVLYSAQTGWDARLKLIEDQVPLVEGSALMGLVKQILRGTGNEAILFKNGSRIRIMSGDSGAGHGRTLDLGVVDEAFDDVDDRREGAMAPAMKTRRNAQLLVPSTAGTDKSLYLRRVVRMGRAAAEAGTTEGIAYFEWSVPKEDEDDYKGEAWDDPATWHKYVPALDETAEASMHHFKSTMSESEFRRAYLNQWMDLETDRVIPAEMWEAICKKDVGPEGTLKFGFDVMPDRSSASLVAVGSGVGELVETFEDLKRIVPRVVTRVAEMSKTHKATIVIDGTGPAASVADDLEKKRVKVERLTSAEYAMACARIFDAIMDDDIRVRSSSQMDLAAAAVRKKPQGDRFVWNRQATTTDVTPIIALTLAFGSPGRSKRPLIATT